MVESDSPRDNDTNLSRNVQTKHEPSEARTSIPSTRHIALSIPKNRSTGNLLGYAAAARNQHKTRAPLDSGYESLQELENNILRSPFMAEHELGNNASGLRRIRQQPPPRNLTLPSEPSSRNASLSRSSSMILDLSSTTRKTSHGALSLLTPASSSPNFTEDLARFPSESLHSFSFAHQSEDFIHNRQNVLKRSIEYMKDRNGVGWPNLQDVALASAQARLSGDQEMQSILELVSKANLLDSESQAQSRDQGNGPHTGPALGNGINVFDKNFSTLQTDNPRQVESPIFSPTSFKSDASTLTLPYPQDALTTKVHEPLPESSSSARRASMKRTYTDVSAVLLENKLKQAMAQPYEAKEAPSADMYITPALTRVPTRDYDSGHTNGSVVHGHSSRWAPAAQAIFTTESSEPWVILAANDLACLVFGVTKGEIRKMGIMEVVREERRAWLREKLARPGSKSELKDDDAPVVSQSKPTTPRQTTSFIVGTPGGITAKLLSKPSSRYATPARRAKTDDGSGVSTVKGKATKGSTNHPANNSRGVLLCGDVVPIQKRNGSTGAASLWVKEKKHGLIWVLEEIHEDEATIRLDEDGNVQNVDGSLLWTENNDHVGLDISKLLPRLPRQGIDGRSGDVDWAELIRLRYFTGRNVDRMNIPVVVEKLPDARNLRVSSFPHIAGIMCLSASTLFVTSSNAVFSAALFGQTQPDGMHITELIPDFDKLLRILVEESNIDLIDGIVVPEHSFRHARALLALKDKKSDPSSYFLHPDGVPAKHRDGSSIKIDVQMRVVKSERHPRQVYEHVIVEEDENRLGEEECEVHESETIYALWVTYSRQLHATNQAQGIASPFASGMQTPLHPGQRAELAPIDMDSDDPVSPIPELNPKALSEQLATVARTALSAISSMVDRKPANENQKLDVQTKKDEAQENVSNAQPPAKKKSISDFVILDEMGQGAYGQVKLARHKVSGEKVVLKYVTKRRILVDTWTRDRRLGTVPLEIHVLDFLRRDDLRHPNVVEMADFFEDDINYYIEMLPHGLPGMDLFDYIELRVNMEEEECKSIFLQVAKAIHHLHTKALVVHRDIKDENIVLDGAGNIKLIDFGSAAYIKNGPFDVFVGTIDYAAPEVLAGKPYKGKEQDVWALGILLYTIVYKENPFYSIDEIMDRDLRVPYIMSEDSIDLIRGMLNRDVGQRLTIEEVTKHTWLEDVVGNLNSI